VLRFDRIIPEQWVAIEATSPLVVFVISLYVSHRSVFGCIQRRQCTPGDLHTVIIIELLIMDEKRTSRSDLKISAWPLTALKLLTVSQSRLWKTS